MNDIFFISDHIFAYLQKYLFMDDWKLKAKRLLKSELIRKGISHKVLALKLNQLGIEETKSSIDSKISRGTFSAAFLLQCLYVLDCNQLFLGKEKSTLSIAAEAVVSYQTKSKNAK